MGEFARNASFTSVMIAALSAIALEPNRELLVDYVPSSVLINPPAQTNDTGLFRFETNGDNAVPLLNPRPHQLTHGERWEKFEAEFGLAEKSPSLLKSSAESAKYQLDRTTFAVNDFVWSVENALSFDYGFRNPTPGHDGTNDTARAMPQLPIPMWDAVQNARFKSDIDLNVPRGRAFVGVKLVLPIGN